MPSPRVALFLLSDAGEAPSPGSRGGYSQMSSGRVKQLFPERLLYSVSAHHSESRRPQLINQGQRITGKQVLPKQEAKCRHRYGHGGVGSWRDDSSCPLDMGRPSLANVGTGADGRMLAPAIRLANTFFQFHGGGKCDAA